MFKASVNPIEGHGGPKLLWAHMLRDNNLSMPLSSAFGLEDFTETGKPWDVDHSSGWEATIIVNSNWDTTEISPERRLAT